MDFLGVVNQVINEELGLSAHEADVRADELVGVQTAHKHLEKTPHVLLELADAFHVQIGAVGLLLDQHFEVSKEVEKPE